MKQTDSAGAMCAVFGDHMREHTTQIAGLRVASGHAPTMSQRILMEAELAWSKLLASTVGLSDDELLKTPPDGGWSLQQILEHMLDSEEGYLVTIRDARIKRRTHSEQRGTTCAIREKSFATRKD